MLLSFFWYLTFAMVIVYNRSFDIEKTGYIVIISIGFFIIVTSLAMGIMHI